MPEEFTSASWLSIVGSCSHCAAVGSPMHYGVLPADVSSAVSALLDHRTLFMVTRCV